MSAISQRQLEVETAIKASHFHSTSFHQADVLQQANEENMTILKDLLNNMAVLAVDTNKAVNRMLERIDNERAGGT